MEQRVQEFRRTDDPVTEQIIGACIEVHRLLGPGLLESAYEQCLCRELGLRGIAFLRQVALPVEYKGVLLDCGYRMDLVVAGTVVVEIKAVDHLQPVHLAQVLTYLKIGGYPTGLLVNFNVTVLKRGLRRLAREI
jgi:GxxExxY protein